MRGRVRRSGCVAGSRLPSQPCVRSSRALQRSADFAVDVAGHELEAARTALQFTGTEPAVDPTEIVQVRAPVDGKVLKLHQECEGVV